MNTSVRRLAFVLSLTVIALTTGCYHAVVNTGRPAGNASIDIPWAHSFLGGLVPPKQVESASTCPSGVARVETRQSFLNLVAQAITLGIYSPMRITVTCASGQAFGDLPLVRDLTEAEIRFEAGQDFLIRVAEAPLLIE